MSKKSFYDLVEPGIVQHLGSHTFDAQEIVEFAAKHDPQSFHLTEEAAKASNFGALCASGWHTASVWMRLNVEDDHSQIFEKVGYDGPAPVFGPSPGIRNIKWTHPVYVDDTITYQTTITGKRKSPNRKGWGMLLSKTQGFNQDGVQVLTMEGAVTVHTDYPAPVDAQ